MLFAISALLLLSLIMAAPVPLHVRLSMNREAHRRYLMHQVGAYKPRDSVTQKWFTQQLDHFEVTSDTQNTTWQQRYWVNTQYWNGNGPVFVQLGEEAAADSSYVTGMAMSEYGAEHNALLVGIEHRGYGASAATPQLDTPSMKYLTVDQALADFAAVIQQVQIDYNAVGQKVVVFGCSYIGAGASWFRQRYGHVAIGAIASSAPVQAVVDFTQYLDVMGRDFTEFYGPQCDAALRNATTQIATLLSTPAGTSKVETMFDSCKPFDGENDVITFWSNVIGNWMGAVQYYSESPMIPTIAQLCQMLTAKADPLDGFLYVFNQFQGGVCLDNSYAEMIAMLQDTTQPADGVGARTWTWQTCAQFGYFQSTDSSSQPFGSGIPVSYYEGMCTDAFGMTFDLNRNINNTNLKFGGNVLPSYAYTNVAFDGSASGVWQILAPQSAVNPTCPLFLFNSEGHCAGVFPLTPNTPPDIVQVHHQISAVIDTWV